MCVSFIGWIKVNSSYNMIASLCKSTLNCSHRVYYKIYIQLLVFLYTV